MGLGEPRLTGQQRTVSRDRRVTVDPLKPPRRAKLPGECVALGLSSLRRQERAIGLEARVIRGRDDQDRFRPNGLGISYDSLQTILEIGKQTLVFQRSIAGRIDKVAVPPLRRRDRDPTGVGGLSDQTTER